jgi:galactokinase
MQTVSIEELYKTAGNDSVKENYERYSRLKEKFLERFENDGEISFFSAPGRCEIIGNHTDHNGGKVIAASIDMDTIAAAAPNGLDVIRICSDGYDDVEVDLEDVRRLAFEKTDVSEKDILLNKYTGSSALVAGISASAVKSGFSVAGFDACVSTNVLPAAGVSSSASYEMLVCAVINFLFNENMMTENECAHFGQYAENVFWKKSSGLMDQIACAVGGAVYVDFGDKDEVAFKKTEVSFEDYGYSLVIINTGKGHADLSHEYSSIPEEMFGVARALGRERLCELDLETVLANASKIGDDRALLRAIHFYNESVRVEKVYRAIEKGYIELVLCLMGESGKSSHELLQNCYCCENPHEQKISLALALTENFLKNENAEGISRVHGGGFAGTILCALQTKALGKYVDYMAGIFGEENVHPVRVRKYGAVMVRLTDTCSMF